MTKLNVEYFKMFIMVQIIEISTIKFLTIILIQFTSDFIIYIQK